MKAKNKKFKTLLQAVNINYFIGLMIILATVGSFPGGVSYTTAYREFIAEVGFIGLLLFWLYRNRHIRPLNIKISNTRLWLSGLILLATFSILWSANIGFFANKYLMWLGAVAVFLLALNLTAKTNTYITIAKTLVFIGVFIAIIGIGQYLFAIDIFVQNASPAANFINKNRAAQVIVLIFPISLFLLLVDKKSMSNLYPFFMALMLSYIFYTQTRAAWLGIGVQIIILSIAFVVLKAKFKHAFAGQILHWSKTKTLNSVLAIIMLFLLINLSADGWNPVWSIISNEINSIVQSAANSSSARYKIWESALIMIQANPIIGSGMGSFYHNILSQSQHYSSISVNVHNDILELGVELGLLGLLLFFGAVISLVLNLFKLISQRDTQQQLFYLLISAAIFGSFVNMQFSFPYQMSVPLTIFALYSGMIVKSSDVYNAKIKILTITISRQYIVGFVGVIWLLVLVLNMIWLNTFSSINNNALDYKKWQQPSNYSTISCHRLVVRTLYALTNFYHNNKDYNSSLSVLKHINQCIPNTWGVENLKARNLLNLQRYDAAILAFEKAKKHHKLGIYQDYIGQYVAYIKIGNIQGAQTVYQQLSQKPETLVAKNKQILSNLIKMSVKFNNKDNAARFYQLYIDNYGTNKELKNLIDG